LTIFSANGSKWLKVAAQVAAVSKLLQIAANGFSKQVWLQVAAVGCCEQLAGHGCYWLQLLVVAAFWFETDCIDISFLSFARPTR